MDSHFMSQLMLSVAIFAPGLILLAGLAFVGLLMLLERTVLRGKLPTATTAPNATATAQNPAAGPVVEGLKDALAQPAADKPAEEAPAKKAANG